MNPALVWYRQDLRVGDQPALHAAAQRGGAVIPVYLWAPEEEGDWAPGGAARWWLHQSLQSLDSALRQAGSRLIYRRGPALEVLRSLVLETGAGAVYWNRRYEPAAIERDRRLTEFFCQAGVEVASFNGSLLVEPWAVANKTGKPYQVFTPFWRACLSGLSVSPPIATPPALAAPRKWPATDPLEALELEPKTPWAEGIRASWEPGESFAQANLKAFLAEAYDRYDEQRDRPDLAGTSRLSPCLHHGEVSVRQVWHALRDAAKSRGLADVHWRSQQFVTELGWREFAYHLLFHFPVTPTEPLRVPFQRFPWRHEPEWMRAWQKGVTGYPLVDAGMRQLWQTGWMHNRVRMVAGSFLVKHLQCHWAEGAKWFWDTLVDADLASNTLGWQWVAGCGADAAPYFRIFNPVSQGEKFDPNGDYVRHWIPELARLPTRWIHRPWEAPPSVARDAGVHLDRDYPAPIISHPIARELALEAYARITLKNAPSGSSAAETRVT